MIQQITVMDEHRVKIGRTFPKRAKQLVNRKKAIWSDEAHTEIILMPTGTGNDADIIDLTGKPLLDKPETGVLDAAEAGFIRKGKSLIKDAYRDDASVVLRSSPLEIIKKSKRRTRELHAAFSAVLWTGAAILYIVINFLMGYRKLTLIPSEISATWLIFIFAGIIECAAEIYFCGKELAVLNENIDLRQINPSKGGDFDLKNYQKKLTKKISFMSSAVLWLPLVMIYCISGYLFGLWGVAWIVFLFGAFFEVLRNFVRKLKRD